MATHSNVDLGEELLFCLRSLRLFVRLEEGHAEGTTSRYYRRLVQLHRMLVEVGDECVTSLMDCRVDSISFCHAQLFTLDAHNDPVSSLVKVIHTCLFLSIMNCLSDGRVHEVLDLCTSEARRHRSQTLRVNGLISGDLAEVEAEDVLATIHVGSRHVDFLIETTWSHRCWIQGLLVIRCTNDHDLVILLEAIHFGQDLIERGPA